MVFGRFDSSLQSNKTKKTMQISNPFEFYGPILCIKGGWLYKETKLLTKYMYDNYVRRGHINVIRHGRGKGNYALVEFESIRPDVKQEIEAFLKKHKIKTPSGDEYNVLTDLIEPDNEAAHYFASIYQKPEGGTLSTKKQLTYLTNAIILNACKKFYTLNVAKKKKGWIWDKLSQSVNDLSTMQDDFGKPKYQMKLPTTPTTLKRAYNRYIKDSYLGLVHGGFGNTNSQVITDAIERIIISIYCMKNKPYYNWVVEIYLDFIAGKTEIVDRKTGELFNPQDFYENGAPVTFSIGTVYNYVNKPANQALIAKYRSGAHQYNNTQRPHAHRHAPAHSLSKISLDDRDLPRKLSNGKRVKAYYAYDVKSGCVVGASYSRDKDNQLFLDCIKDMLRFLGNNNLGVPMEMEVEHHIVNNFRNDLMKAGVAFPFVRWCNPGNSQEKRAEHFNKRKKYGYEKRYQDGIGRWYAKSEAHRTVVEKIFDSENNNYKERKFEYERLVADDLFTIEQYNNDLHPNQKEYAGMTRMEVLKATENPKCNKFDEVIWSKYVGEKRATSIRRNQYMQVDYTKFGLPSPEVIKMLQPNNKNVDAYFIRNEEGAIDYIDVFQGEEYICRCEPIETFNEATAEHTDEDRRIMLEQQKYIAKYDAMIKQLGEEKRTPLQITESVSYPEVSQEAKEIEYIPKPLTSEDSNGDFEKLLADYSSEETLKRANESLYSIND